MPPEYPGWEACHAYRHRIYPDDLYVVTNATPEQFAQAVDRQTKQTNAGWPINIEEVLNNMGLFAATGNYACWRDEPARPRKFRVEMQFANGGWDDAEWTEDGKPLLFKTQAEAVAAIAEHCKDCDEAVAAGNMSTTHSPHEFRVVPE